MGGSKGVLTEVLEETKAGIHALSKSQLRASIIAMYREFIDCGQVQFHGEARAIERYSHRQMARRFANVLDVTAGGESSQVKSHSPSNVQALTRLP